MPNYAEHPIHLAGGLIFDGTGSALFPGDVLVVGNRIDDIAVLQDRDRINLVMKDGQIYRDEISIPGRSR